MKIHNAVFIKSSALLEELPEADKPEYAFVGRSNVGKSSLINCLCNRNKLAKTSSTPGKTQLMNHFLINDSWYLVDLPGYGYARVSKTSRGKFQKMILDYVNKRKTLMNVFVLVDGRHTPQKIDIEFMEYLGTAQIPFTIIFTKMDKPNQRARVANLKAYKAKLLETWEELPPMIFTSSEKGTGKQEVLDLIDKTNSFFEGA